MDIQGTPLEEAPADAQATAGDDRGSAISVRGLSHHFGELETLNEVNFDVTDGETVAIVGTSGCGKSTLLEIVGGLAEQTSGSVSVGGETSTAGRLSHCTWMPQRDLLLPWRRVIDNAALGLRIGGASRSEARAAASAMLERLGLGQFERARPDELSGGMRQRVAFARTLLAGRPVLLLDEPLAALDAITRADLQEWLIGTLREERRTTLLVTHDVEEALYLADRVLLLSARPGHVVWEAASPADRAMNRPEAISSPDFVACRERALLALAESSR